MRLQPEKKAFIVIGIALGLSLIATLFDVFIINNMFDIKILYYISISTAIIELFVSFLIGWAIYIRFPNEITKLCPLVAVALAGGFMILEYKQKWYNMDYQLAILIFLGIHTVFVLGFTFLSVWHIDDKEIEFIVVEPIN